MNNSIGYYYLQGENGIFNNKGKNYIKTVNVYKCIIQEGKTNTRAKTIL